MISLTNPIVIAHTLGAIGTPAYNKVILDDLTYSPVKQSIVGTVVVSCTDGSHPTVKGKFEITGISVNLIVPDLDINQTGSLTPEQQGIVKSYIDNAQSSIENGLIAISLITGTFAPGI